LPKNSRTIVNTVSKRANGNPGLNKRQRQQNESTENFNGIMIGLIARSPDFGSTSSKQFFFFDFYILNIF